MSEADIGDNPANDEGSCAGSEEDTGPARPIEVQYCQNCGLPLEYCEYGPDPEKCQQVADGIATLTVSEKPKEEEAAPEVDAEAEKEAKKEKKKKKKKEEAPAITVCSEQRKGRKVVTVIRGLELFNIKGKDATKKFSNKFSCGTSASKDHLGPHLVVQGDFVDQMAEFISEAFKVPPEAVQVKA
eukprot:Rmarinus@m.23861